MMTILTILLVACIALIIGLLVYRNPFSNVRTAAEPGNVVAEARSAEEQATRELIGDRKYEEMSRHVSDLLKRHANDSFKTVMLTAGSVESHALKTLHSLLPGDTVRLQDNTRHGVPDVGVYVGEERVGRLLLDDATSALEALRGTLVTGAYVAEQNSYGESSNTISIKLIIFYTSAEMPSKASCSTSKTPYKVVYRGLRPIVIYQN